MKNSFIIFLLSCMSAFGQIRPNPYTTNINASLPPPTRTNALFPTVVSVESFGAVHDGVTDDTAAFQAAIDQSSNGNVHIIVPSGVYFINGQFTAPPGSATLTNFCQLHLPSRNLFSNTVVTIWIEGVTKPGFNTIWTTNSFPTPTNNVTILSTRVPTNNLYSIISGGAPTGSVVPQTGVYLILENLDFRTYDNPTTTALNLAWTAQATIKDCVVETGTGGGNQSNPTNGASGIILPANNNWCIAQVNNVDVRGYYNGVVVNEHANMDEVRIWLCRQAFNFSGGTHTIYMGDTLVTACPVGVVGPPAGGFNQRIFWANYEVEHSTLGSNNVAGAMSWTTNIYDFADTNSAMNGIVHYAAVQSGFGGTNDLQILSGSSTNLIFFNENAHSFTKVRVTPNTTNFFDNVRLVYGKNYDGSGIFNIGAYPPPFDYIKALYLGPGTFDNTWQQATNFSLSSDGTNHTVLNAPQQAAGTLSTNSSIKFQVGHVGVGEATFTNWIFLQPMQHGFITTSNYTSGTFNTNQWGAPIHVTAQVSVGQSVSGAASMQLWILTLVSNTFSIQTIGTNFGQLQGDIPTNGVFVFTNQSTGAGNTATLFRSVVKGD